MHDKVDINCPIHGKFRQKAQSHVRGIGCSKCSGNEKTTKEKLITISNQLHGNTFSYENTQIKSRKDLIEIQHKQFGIFHQRLDTHIKGLLPDRLKCLISIEDLISKYNIIDVSSYLNYKSRNIELRCHIHGNFSVSMSKKSSFCKLKCKLCDIKERMQNLISKFGSIEYNYSLMSECEFKINNKVPIICKKHGVFYQTIGNHFYNKQRCSKCVGGIKLPMFEIASKTNYRVMSYQKGYVDLNCNIHGIFRKSVTKLQQGCPKCGDKSTGEKAISNFMEQSDIKFEKQKKMSGCKYKRDLRFDFYLPEYNVCVEYDGKQHFEPVFGDIEFELTIVRDDIKTKYCNDNHIELIRISYKDKDQIIDILKDRLKLS